MASVAVWLVPIGILLALAAYVIASLRVAYRKAGSQAEKSTSHSERAYQAFGFFITAAVAIFGGIGYLRISVMADDPVLARQAMTGLAGLQFAASTLQVISATVHLGSKFERWQQGVLLREFWRWIETWMMIFAYLIGAAAWVIARTW